jgi:hypothetical protein
MTPFVIALVAAPIVVWLLRRPQGRSASKPLPQEPRAAAEDIPGTPPPHAEEAQTPETPSATCQDVAASAPAGKSGGIETQAGETSGAVIVVPEPADAGPEEPRGLFIPSTRDESAATAAGHEEPDSPAKVAETPVQPLSENLRAETAEDGAESGIAGGRDETLSGNGLSGVADEPSVIRACSAPEAGTPVPGDGAAAEQPANNAVAKAECPAGEPGHALEPAEASAGGEPEPLTEEPEQTESERNGVSTKGAGFVVEPSSPIAPAETSQSRASPGGEQEAAEPGEVAPSRYRPPPQCQPRRPSAPGASEERRPRSPSVLEIRVRLMLDRYGFCRISLLPERRQDMDEEITVKTGALRLSLAAQEDWYSDIEFDDVGERLRQGVRLTGLLSGGWRVEWQLSSGRDIYVLAGHPSASGFVSVPRLALGRTHAVLCANGVLEQAEAILKHAGCKGYTKLDASHGVPDGWAGLRGVLPETALALDPGTDPFYALKPAPDIEISLEGGLLFHDAAWLAGYPPQISVTGEMAAALRVLIDGKEAHATDGCYTAAGFDAPGQHLVECEGLSRSHSYSIEEPAESWEQWEAYAFSGASVCGPLVALRPEARGNRIFNVPMSNPLLLGAEPGQVFRCSHRNVANWQGFVPFEVVWALPAQPLICDKKTSRILCFSSAPVAPAKRNAMPPLGWCSAILDASRKGLRIEGDSPGCAAQWVEYKKAARNIWRGRR